MPRKSSPLRSDEVRRLLFRSELDSVNILDTARASTARTLPAPKIKNQSGQITQPSAYVTIDTILRIDGAMSESIHRGVPYQTRSILRLDHRKFCWRLHS